MAANAMNSITVFLTVEQKKRLRMIAEQRGLSMSTYIRSIIDQPMLEDYRQIVGEGVVVDETQPFADPNYQVTREEK